MLAGFPHAAFTSRTISAALGPVVGTANQAFVARRTSVWLYERRSGELRCAAASGGAADGEPPPGPASPSTPAGRGLRLERAVALPDAGERTIAAPLRGTRRALGTLVIEGVTSTAIDDDIALADNVSRLLAIAIENVYLLDEVLRQRRLLEDTFNSLSDLVVVTDTDLRVVQTNKAFAAHVGSLADALVNRPLAELIAGLDPTATWKPRPAAAPLRRRAAARHV